MEARNFFLDDIYSPEALEKAIDAVKVEMLRKLYFDKLKGKDEQEFTFSFHKDYWTDYRINEEIDKYFRITNGLYRHPNPTTNCYISREELFDMIKSKKPFDIVLKRKTLGDLPYFKPL
jgi:hypothetical protein